MKAKQAVTVAVPMVALIIAFMVLNRDKTQVIVEPEQIEMVSEVKGQNLTYLKQHMPAPAVSNAVQATEWTISQAEALPILLRYMPDATEAQQRAATEYVYHYRSFKPDWREQAKLIRKHLSDLNSPDVPQTARVEIGRIHETEWKILMATVNDVMETLKKSETEFFANNGFTDPNLQSDLYNAANPPGKEPWEE